MLIRLIRLIKYGGYYIIIWRIIIFLMEAIKREQFCLYSMTCSPEKWQWETRRQYIDDTVLSIS